VVDVPAFESEPDTTWRELRPILDAEINRLPRRYKTAFVLCCLQGHTKQEAAHKLGLPVGTLSSRLARARDRLRLRLARRGVVLSVAGLLGLMHGHASATVPAMLFESTLRAAVLMAADQLTLSVVSPSVMALTKGVLHAMFWTRLKTAAGAILLLSLVGLGIGAAYRPQPPADDKKDDALFRQTQPPPRQVTGENSLTPPALDNGDDDTVVEHKAPPRTQLVGEWIGLSEERDGRVTDFASSNMPVTFGFQRDGIGEWRTGTGKRSTGTGTQSHTMTFHYRVARADSRQPLIDIINIAGGNPMNMQGIYRIEGDWLLMCLAWDSGHNSAQPPLDRPRSFEAAKPHQMVLLFRRAGAPPVAVDDQRTLREVNARLHATVEQATTESQTLRTAVETLKKHRDEERARSEAARAQAAAEAARLTLENMRLRARLDQLQRQLRHLKQEQKALEGEHPSPE